MENVTTDAATGELGRMVDRVTQRIDEVAGALESWRHRALIAEAGLAEKPGTVIVVRDDLLPLHVDRIHGWARISNDRGEVVFIGPKALALACVAAGVELKR